MPQLVPGIPKPAHKVSYWEAIPYKRASRHGTSAWLTTRPDPSFRVDGRNQVEPYPQCTPNSYRHSQPTSGPRHVAFLENLVFLFNSEYFQSQPNRFWKVGPSPSATAGLKTLNFIQRRSRLPPPQLPAIKLLERGVGEERNLNSGWTPRPCSTPAIRKG